MTTKAEDMSTQIATLATAIRILSWHIEQVRPGARAELLDVRRMVAQATGQQYADV